jgi:ParB family chromosome partitioning protein
MAKRIVVEELSVRAVEEAIRQQARAEEESALPGETTTSVVGDEDGSPSSGLEAGRRRLPAPGLLELEELLSAYLNTRVKVDMGAKHGRVVVDFATLEDLERIYKLMVGDSSTIG